MNKRKSGIVITAALTFAVSSTSIAASSESALTAGAGNSVPAELSGEAVYTSTENIYAALAADGSFQNAYVVNSYDVEKAGEITSYGDYDSVKNLTTLKAIQSENGEQTFASEAGKFYYQGNTDSIELPWNISITYYLDGNQVSAEELAGKSGALEIRLKTAKNEAVTPEFYENYMLQITFTLDMELCSNIQAEGAAAAEAGSSKTIIYTVLPDSDADISLKADVTDFEMTGMSIAAVPFSMTFDLPDTSEMSDGLTELSDAIQQLNSGVKELSSGMGQLSSNAGVLRDGSAEVAAGLNTLRENSGTLVDASAQIQGALQLLDGGVSQMDMESLTQLQALPEMLNTLSGGLEEMAAGVTMLQEGYTQAYQALDAAMEGIPEAAVTEEQLMALGAAAATNEDAMAAYQELAANYQAAQVVKGTYSVVKEAFAAVDSTLPELIKGIGEVQAGTSQMSAGLSEAFAENDLSAAMSQLQTGIRTLSENYTAFHNGLVGYTDGVNALASGYSELNEGLNTYLNGVGEASAGTQILESGVNTLAVNTENIPEEMQEQIDEFMSAYDFDFVPVSFMDSRNQAVESVQFVISVPGIKTVEEEAEEETIIEEKGFFDKLKVLFS